MKKMKLTKGIISIMVFMLFLTISTVDGKAATESGSYPTRKGVILVTADAYKNLIPTGHAAIIYSKTKVVESVASGVSWGKNNWKSTKKTVFGVGVKATSEKQDAKAADWCKKRIGKAYNYNYFNVNTREKFYCSQLVWAAYKDLYGVNMNTAVFGSAIHPLELVSSAQTSLVYSYVK